MFKLGKKEFLIPLLILFVTAYIYRGVFLKNQIAFPANLLASFYSPWATQKFANYPNGIPNKPIGGNDLVRMFYPYRTFTIESLKRFEFPLWNPYNFSGSPILADFQSAIFYPLNIIYFLFSQETAWSLLVIIQPLLGTVFMYLYLRQFIPQKIAALFGAFAFGFSGFILAWSQENSVVAQAALWFPLILFAVDKIISTFKIKYFILLIISLTTCIFAGFLQITFYIFLTAFLYGIFKVLNLSRKIRLSRFLGFISALFISFLITAIQILPSIEAFANSARSTSSIETVVNTYLLPMSHYIIALAPDIFGNPGSYNFFGIGFYQESIFYIGIIPLVFAIYAILKIRKNKTVLFFICLAIVTFSLGVKSFFTVWLYSLSIPLVNTFTPSRILFVTSSSLAILSAFGFSHWLKTGINKTRPLFLIILGVGSILILFFVYHYLSVFYGNNILVIFIDKLIHPSFHLSKESIRISGRNLILPLLMLFLIMPLILLQKKFRIAKIFILLLVFLGQFYFLNKYIVIGDKQFLYPDHFIFSDLQQLKNTERFLSFGLPILGDVALSKQVFSPDGIDPVFPRRYGQLVDAAKNDGKFTNNIPRIEVNLSEYDDKYHLVNNYRRFKLMSLLGVSRIYNYEADNQDLKKFDQIFPKDSFKPLWKHDKWQAYEFLNTYPRVFFVDNYLVAKDTQKNLDLIFDKNTDLKETVILEEEPKESLTLNNKQLSGTSNATIIKYEPLNVQLKVITDSDKILFLSDNYYPGWEASVDGNPVKIYRADFTFRAVVVPKGNHIVTFFFRPMSFITGAIISIISILLLIIIILIIFWRKQIKLNAINT